MRDNPKTLFEHPPQIEFTSRAEVALSHARNVSAKSRAALRALIKEDVNIIEHRLGEKREPYRTL